MSKCHVSLSQSSKLGSNTCALSLIMLLIQADFIKSVAFVICPIVQFFRGPVASNSAFCQVSGFFLALGIEASDVAVLLIAVHSAMYIHRPRSGLYPWRRWAYAAYVVFPTILASLAFADSGYDNLGAYCYLSRDHGWSRLALSWVPRYILMLFIAVTYLCIYIYVRTRLHRYDCKDSTSQPSIPSCEKPSVTLPHRDRPHPISLFSNMSGNSTDEASQSPLWALSARGPIDRTTPFYYGLSERVQVPNDGQHPSLPFAPDLAVPLPTVAWSRPCSSATAVASSPSHSWYIDPKSGLALATNGSIDRDMPESTSSLLHDIRQVGLSDRVSGQQPSSFELTDLSTNTLFTPEEEPESEVARNRERIRRQLRSLFVYPLIYVLTWLFPLINQVYGHIGMSKPLWMLCLSVVGFSVQGFANTVVFASREKPWRHTGMNGFLVAVRVKLLGGPTTGQSGGQTRDERMIDAQTARIRRDGEIMDETDAAVTTAKTSQQSKGIIRNWWDASELYADLERITTRSSAVR